MNLEQLVEGSAPNGRDRCAKDAAASSAPVQLPFISYAQNFEDVMLWRALKHVRNGFYIDVGANDPVVDSVSKAFYDRGWRGIHVEPTPQYADLLRRHRPDEIILEIALSDKNGVIDLNYIPDTGISTAIDEYAAQHIDQHKFENHRIKVPALTVTSAFDHIKNSEVHWFKIDVEGLEEQVLKGWDSNALRPWVMVVEATVPGSNCPFFADWEPILIQANYHFVYFDGLNRFYVAAEHAELIPAFSAPPNVFDEAQLSGLGNSAWCGVVRSEANQYLTLANQLTEKSAGLSERIEEAVAREQVLQARLAEAEQREQGLLERLAEAEQREQGLLGRLAEAEQHQHTLSELLKRASQREDFLMQRLDVLSRIHTILAERSAKGPLRLRQLVRHPKAFVRESFGLKGARKAYRAPHLKSGFVDAAGEQRLSLRWIFRQPTKAIAILVRHPRKAIRFMVRHPRKFFSGSRIATPAVTCALALESPDQHQNQEDSGINLSPEALEISVQLRRSIERNKRNAHRY